MTKLPEDKDAIAPDDGESQQLPRYLRRHILQAFRLPDNAYGCFHAAWPVLLVFGLLVFASSASVVHALWLIPAIGWTYYRIYFPLHDCSHYTLVRSKTANIAIGYFLAALVMTPFRSYQKEHIQHHIHYGTIQDPGAVDYYVRFKSRGEMARFLLAPLWGGSLLVKLRDYYRHLPWAGSVLEQQAGRASPSRPHGHADIPGYLAIIAVQLCVLALVTGLHFASLWRYPLFVIAPGATVFLFLNRLRMFLEHGSLDYGKHDYFSRPRRTARNFACGCLELALISGKSFQYHHEHHLFPPIPPCRLKAVHGQLASYIDAEDTRPSYAGALREIWNNLEREAAASHASG